jgi:hypothetical protein
VDHKWSKKSFEASLVFCSRRLISRNSGGQVVLRETSQTISPLGSESLIRHGKFDAAHQALTIALTWSNTARPTIPNE